MVVTRVHSPYCNLGFSMHTPVLAYLYHRQSLEEGEGVQRNLELHCIKVVFSITQAEELTEERHKRELAEQLSEEADTERGKLQVSILYSQLTLQDRSPTYTY